MKPNAKALCHPRLCPLGALSDLNLFVCFLRLDSIQFLRNAIASRSTVSSMLRQLKRSDMMARYKLTISHC